MQYKNLDKTIKQTEHKLEKAKILMHLSLSSTKSKQIIATNKMMILGEKLAMLRDMKTKGAI